MRVLKQRNSETRQTCCSYIRSRTPGNCPMSHARNHYDISRSQVLLIFRCNFGMNGIQKLSRLGLRGLSDLTKNVQSSVNLAEESRNFGLIASNIDDTITETMPDRRKKRESMKFYSHQKFRDVHQKVFSEISGNSLPALGMPYRPDISNARRMYPEKSGDNNY